MNFDSNSKYIRIIKKRENLCFLSNDSVMQYLNFYFRDNFLDPKKKTKISTNQKVKNFLSLNIFSRSSFILRTWSRYAQMTLIPFKTMAHKNIN